MSGTKVLVTRPANEAERWVTALRGAGLDAESLPLIDILPLADAAPIVRMWRQLDRFDAAMFVSAAAVRHFLGATAGGERGELPPRLRCWATGPGTVRALEEAGVAPPRIDAPPATAEQFDSEALWHVVARQVAPGFRLLLVRGADAGGRLAGRDWLATRVHESGGRCEGLAVYRRAAPALTPAQQDRLAAAARGDAVLVFSSSEAIANLRRLLPGADWQQARAVATHPRIAQAAKQAGFDRVRAVRASPAALAASIESAA